MEPQLRSGILTNLPLRLQVNSQFTKLVALINPLNLSQRNAIRYFFPRYSNTSWSLLVFFQLLILLIKLSISSSAEATPATTVVHTRSKMHESSRSLKADDYPKRFCRYSGGYLTYSQYQNLSCAQCFAFIFPENELGLYQEAYLARKRDILKVLSLPWGKRSPTKTPIISDAIPFRNGNTTILKDQVSSRNIKTKRDQIYQVYYLTTTSSLLSPNTKIVLKKFHDLGSQNGRKEQVINPYEYNKNYDPTTDQQIKIYYPDSENSDSLVYSFLQSDKERHSWRDCCREAMACCNSHVVSVLTRKEELDLYTPEPNDYCPATWDGWQCWPRAKADSVNYLPCPGYIHGGNFHISLGSKIQKSCQPNGTWFRVYNPKYQTFKEWSNYTQCLQIDLYYRRQYVRIVAYIISILAIIPALIIYKIFNLLRTTRVVLHTNLMVSFLLKAITVIIFDIFYISQQSWKDHSPDGKLPMNICNVIAFCNKYLLLTTYCWMFTEGIYLYNILVFALSFKAPIRLYMVFGWGFPVIPLIIYIAIKRSYDRNGCWIMTVSNLDWIINSICIIIILINVIFLIQIIRIIVVKLKSGVQKEHLWYRQMLKAVIFLIPLFGIQILLTLYRPPVSNGFLEAYHIINSLIEGLQGFFVALIFCYLNGEVIAKFRGLRRESEEKSGIANHQKSLLHPSINSPRISY